ncbi:MULTISPECIES: polyprenyl synthetase family protein [unclassified Moraxella]|uniref:polyprenyl synthetase family protein n=1 Tax=unclassified Moraxella TaxID=2685852 RepID=UPI003AF88A88
MPNFSQFSTTIIDQHHADISDFITANKLPEPLHSACLYAMTNGGKRVRPLLIASSYATLTAHDIKTLPTSLPKSVCQAMLTVECLHAYSLIHDDMPCMDDDDLRRGKPTTHIKFGEAAALLAGDVLQTLAFEALSDEYLADKTLSANLLTVFAPRAKRMVIGQMLDINGEQQTLDQSELEAIHRDKTGALIEASVLMGGICANATETQLQALAVFATNIGLAFQVQDDILDVTADTEQLGKPAGSDEKLDKSTYVKLLGVEQAKTYAQSLFDTAKNAVIAEFGDTNYLVDLADWLWAREK